MGSDFDLNNESKTKKVKKSAKRINKGKAKLPLHVSSQDWQEDQKRVCDSFGSLVEYIDISELKETIKVSRTRAALLESAEDVKVYYDPQTASSQFYTQEENSVIAINPHHSKGNLVNMLVRELRRAWQHKNDALANPMEFEPEAAILVNRAQHSDAFMVSVKVAWELKLQGENDAWDAMVTSPEGAITNSFEVAAQEDFRTLNNGMASRSAYDKFFDAAHTKAHDKRIIHQMLLDDKGYMKAGAKCDAVSIELLHKLGEMPNAANYLLSSNTGKEVPTSAQYFAVDDRSNANFLWFIKFERSFQEKEAAMLQESISKTAEIVDFAQTLKARNAEPQLAN